MARHEENQGFICLHCGQLVTPLTNGSYRNHCPACLHSLHVDIEPGDRAARCGGLMAPIGLAYKPKMGWQIIHRCRRCGRQSCNKAANDGETPDDPAALSALNHRHWKNLVSEVKS